MTIQNGLINIFRKLRFDKRPRCILVASLIMNCLFADIAWAHGDIPIIFWCGIYSFIAGIITACVFALVIKGQPIVASVAGMFVGILIAIMMFSLWEWDLLALLFPVGIGIYFFPALLIGITIGFIFLQFRKNPGKVRQRKK
jgi:hypothetical protein